MSATDQQTQTESTPHEPKADMKLEVLLLPISDVDRAKDFYTRAGWRLDADRASSSELRVVQVTPPGSACSVIFGTNLTSAAPGSAQGTHLVVSDIEEARGALLAGGIEVSPSYHCSNGTACRFADAGGNLDPDGAGAREPGPATDHGSYGSFASFADPDGNTWILQEVTERLPGRITTGITSYVSAADLANAMRRASEAHGQHEQRIGAADPDWPDWYAEYMVREQSGEELPL
jgi:catechol 2,3-dioxygenase-like lactoylglutathione lyase family enzyme